MNAEQRRLAETGSGGQRWRKWGPYLSDRQWGTVREDYSEDGEAWEHFNYEMARSRAYRWGEDGLAGFSDHRQRICLGLALWNGEDPHLKERLFGLTNAQGNHGEDVKEFYYYLDATPTHSYLKMLYKYPQRAFPYAELVRANAERSLDEPEFELLDTRMFDNDRYFDVIVEYAKADPEDILMRVTAWNRGPERATLHIIPQIWFRNTWSWGRENGEKPLLRLANGEPKLSVQHPQIGVFGFHCEGKPEVLFTENETNRQRLYGVGERQGYWKDAFHEYLVSRKRTTVNPRHSGTKAAAHYEFSVPAGQSVTVRTRLAKSSPDADLAAFDDVVETRHSEADEFYADLQKDLQDQDARLIQRQALAGMIWSKQFYYYDIPQWLDGDPAQPKPPAARRTNRNADWPHLNNADIISMPDKWEYPWYAAWDEWHCRLV